MLALHGPKSTPRSGWAGISRKDALQPASCQSRQTMPKGAVKGWKTATKARGRPRPGRARRWGPGRLQRWRALPWRRQGAGRGRRCLHLRRGRGGAGGGLSGGRARAAAGGGAAGRAAHAGGRSGGKGVLGR